MSNREGVVKQYNLHQEDVGSFEVMQFCWGGGGGKGVGGGVLGSTFAGYVPPASQNPYPIIVCFVTYYRPHLSHFWANG